MPEESAPGPDGGRALPFRCGDYTLLEEVGRGPRGTVYRAERDGRSWAVKLFRPGVPIDRAVLDRFLRASSAPLRHPNLLPLEELGSAGGADYAVMRLLPGDPLRRLFDDLRRRSTARPSLSPLSVGPDGEPHPDCLRHGIERLVEVALGLEHCHQQGISHGRVSPANLIFSPGGRLVLTDFGGEAQGTHLEPLPYRAPEQLAGDAAIETCRSDVYTLGAILYELAALEPPFTGGREDLSVRELRRAIRHGRLRPPGAVRDGVPEALEEVILRALALEPEERYSSAGRLAEDLLRFLRGEPTLASRSLRVQRAVEDVARPWQQIALRLAAGIFLLSATFGGAWLGRELWHEERDAAPGAGAFTAFNRARVEPRTSTAAAVEAGAAAGAPPAASHLVRALRALTAGEVGAALAEVASARRLLPQEKELASLHAELASRGRPDLLERDLSDERLAVRLDGLERLREELACGERPAADARLAAPALLSTRAEERTLAADILGLTGSSHLLLQALGVGGGESAPSRIDSALFADAFETLAEIGDPPAFELHRLWDLPLLMELDALRPGESLSLPPNLRVEAREHGGRTFAKAWIAAAASLRPAALLARVDELLEVPDLASALIENLARMGTPAARDALEDVVRRRFAAGGPEALHALVAAGACSSLAHLLDEPLAVAVRCRIIEALAAGFLDSHAVRDELASIVSRSPWSDLRACALGALSALDGSDGWDPAPSVLAAVLDPALEAAALRWWERTCVPVRTELALEFLSHPSRDVRARAARQLLGDSGSVRLAPLLLELVSSDPARRRAALEVLIARDDVGKLAERARVRILALARRSAGALAAELARIGRTAGAGALADTLRARISAWKANRRAKETGAGGTKGT